MLEGELWKLRIIIEGVIYLEGIIFYFFGTGNSLAVARDIAGKLGDTKLIPISDMLKNRNFENRKIGFVNSNKQNSAQDEPRAEFLSHIYYLLIWLHKHLCPVNRAVGFFSGSHARLRVGCR